MLLDCIFYFGERFRGQGEHGLQCVQDGEFNSHLAHLHISNSLSEQGVGTARLAIQDGVEILAITLGDDFSINLSLYSYFDIRILKHFSDL